MLLISLIPLLVIVSAFFLKKKRRYFVLGIGILSYVVVLVVLSKNYVTKARNVELLEAIEWSDSAPEGKECAYMMTDTIDLMKKNRLWTDCLADVAKGGMTPTRVNECKYNRELVTHTMKERTDSYNKYFVK